MSRRDTVGKVYPNKAKPPVESKTTVSSGTKESQQVIKPVEPKEPAIIAAKPKVAPVVKAAAPAVPKKEEPVAPKKEDVPE